jgi:hypothetical protein
LPVAAVNDAWRAGAGDGAGSSESGTSTAGCQGDGGGVVGGGGGGQPANARSDGGGTLVVVVVLAMDAVVPGVGTSALADRAALGPRAGRLALDPLQALAASTEVSMRTAVVTAMAQVARNRTVGRRNTRFSGIWATASPSFCRLTATSVPLTHSTDRDGETRSSARVTR